MPKNKKERFGKIKKLVNRMEKHWALVWELVAELTEIAWEQEEEIKQLKEKLKRR